MNDVLLAQVAGGGPSPFAPFLLMAVIFGIFYVLVIRPQQAREKAKSEMQAALAKGDDVLTSGGIFGRVTETREDSVLIEVAPNVRLRFERRSVEARVDKSAKGGKKAAAGGGSAK